MNVSFERRLTVASAVVIGGGFVTIVLLLALFALSIYVSALNRDVHGALADAGTVLRAHHEPSDARVAGRLLTEHYFNPQLQLGLLDQRRRVDIVRTSQGSPYTVSVADRNDVPREFPPNTVASRSLIALATLLGLETDREAFGSILVVVRAQQAALAVAVLQFLPMFVLALACAAGLSIAFARVLAVQALRPLNNVTRALECLAAGDLTPRILPADQEDQLRDLTRAYNGAIARVQSAFDERDDAHAGMRQFIADAGHQLRTPLTVVRGFIGILMRGSLRDASDFARILDSMNRQCVTMGSLIEKLILLDVWERSGDDAVEAVDVSQLVEDVATPLAEAAPSHAVTIDVQPGALARIDPIGCSHAITNLVDNAMKYAPGSPIDVTLVCEGDIIRIDVADRGPGMTEDEARHVFDRFYRGPLHRAVAGSGLGLPIARSAIERARGTLTVESAPGAGSRFIIRLPRVAAAIAVTAVTA